MIDMRGEEEAILRPHSQVRHERMHNQYNKMKEEEDHWQDVSISVSFSLFVSTPSDVCGQHSCLVSGATEILISACVY